MTLAQQQSWLLSQILAGPNTISPEPTTVMITSSDKFSERARLAVYQQGYLLRLVECLAVEFPILQLFLGEDLFRTFAYSYISHRPSTNYSLYELGDGFANFLATTKPKLPQQEASPVLESGEKARVSYMDLPEQIAQLERAQALSLRGDASLDKCSGKTVHLNDASNLSEQQYATSLSAILSLQNTPKVSLPATSFLVQTDFNLLEYLQTTEVYFAARDKNKGQLKEQSEYTNTSVAKPNKPKMEQQSLLVFRDKFQVNIVRLTQWQSKLVLMLETQGEIDWQPLAKQENIDTFELLLKAEHWLAIATKKNMLIKAP